MPEKRVTLSPAELHALALEAGEDAIEILESSSDERGDYVVALAHGTEREDPFIIVRTNPRGDKTSVARATTDEGYATALYPPAVVPAGEEPPQGAGTNVYAIGAVFVVTASNARAAWNFFESSEHSSGAHAASNPHAITREQAMDPDWTIGLTYGATELTPIPADEEEQS